MLAPTRIGPYRIERLLGTGSFATVWLGYDASLGARVAIKVLAENWSHDLRVRERFLDEARLLWRLDHDRVVRVYTLGELDDGRPYLVMAWAEGGSLRDRLAAGPVPVEAGLWLLREITAGVAVLHDHDIVHRDLTPGNVLFRSRPGAANLGPSAEQVVIADLGLAKALAAASGLTARAGTPGYMAPEQDDPLSVVDTRTDVYGLGRLGATLLGAPTAPTSDSRAVDRRAFDSRASAGRTSGGRASGGRVRLRDGVPAKVAEVLRTATAHRPAERYPDAAAFAAALDRACSGQRRPGAAAPPRKAAPHKTAPPHLIALPRHDVGPKAGAPGRRPAARARRAVLTAGVALVAAAAVAGPAADSPTGLARSEPGTAADVTGRITVTLPAGWQATGAGWEGRRRSDGQRDPALLISPDPRRWGDPAVPGAFVGLPGGLAPGTTAAAYVAGQPHARCTSDPVRTSHQAGFDWTVARFTACPAGPPTVVETAALGPGAAGLVYVQIAPPAGSGPDFVDALLAGVRVRPT